MSALKQEICPVSGKRINKDWFVDYNGKRIYFCCPSCPATFKKDPEKYMEEFRERGIELENTPPSTQDHGMHRKGARKEPHGGHRKG